MTKARVTPVSIESMIGDLASPEGSPSWCSGMRTEIQKIISDYKRDHESLQKCVAYFIEMKGWEKLEDAKGRPFRSYADFCKAKQPHGLGRDPAEIDALIAEGRAKAASERVAAAAGATTGEVLPHGGDRKGERSSNNLSLDPASTRAADRGVHPNTQRKLDRLARERPDLHEQVKAGKLSANRAAIQAGFVKVPTPLEAAQKAYLRLSEDDQLAFHDWLLIEQ